MPAKTLPELEIYPPHPALRDRFNALIRVVASHRGITHVKHIRFIGERSEIRVRTRQIGRNNRNVHGSSAVAQIKEQWDAANEVQPIYEADLWDDLLQKYVPDTRIRNWAANIIWFDRSERAKDAHKERWEQFAAKYSQPFRLSLQEFLKIAGHLCTKAEISAIKNQFVTHGVQPSIIVCQQRRKKANATIKAYEISLVNAALEAVGYAKRLK